MIAWLAHRRTVFTQLVLGALVVLAGVAVLWLGASSFFLRVMDRANERRWMASAIANQLLRLRLEEKDFLLRDALDTAFYTTGDAQSLQEHTASLTLTTTWIDSLARLSEGEQRATAVQLHRDVDAVGAGFHDLVVAIRQRGIAAARAHTTDTTLATLQAQVDDQVDALDPVLAGMIVSSVQDSQAARRRLVAAAPIIILLGIGLAIALFYGFATGVSRITTALERAASDIGQGRFDSRVDVTMQNELGRLATAFNRMSANLAALVGAVHESSTQINTSTLEIAATAQQQQATAGEIAVTTREVGATAKTISATLQDLAGTVNRVASVAEEAGTLADAGRGGLTRLDKTMQQLADASVAVNARLAALSEKAGAITSIVTTIIKVADQTNLLSLNAAIEAEKAGEAGRGFSVVAQEIRRLADQTAVATGEIEQIIKEMQGAVTASVMGMDKFSDETRRGVEVSNQVGSQLLEIIRKVQALVPDLEGVNHGMQSQTEGAQQITEALAQLSAAVQQTAESLVRSNQAIEQLNGVSQHLQAGVSRFTIPA